MRTNSLTIAIFTTLLLTIAVSSTANAKDIEGQIPWDLTDLYVSADAWTQEYERTLTSAKALSELQGTLGKSANSLQFASDQISAVYKDALRLIVYARLKGDEDLRESHHQERISQARSLMAIVSQNVSFFSPEILELGSKKVEKFIRKNKGLAVHAFSLRNTLRQEAHTLSLESETVMANTNELLGGPKKIYNLLVNAAIEWPEVTLSNGETITLNQTGYGQYRAVQNREDRKKVFETFWGVWADHEAPLGAILDTHVKGHIFRAKSRHYESALASATSGSNIPTDVYKKLVSFVNKNLGNMHRYLKLRQRMLGLEDLHYYDIYPESTSLDKAFSVDDAKTLTLASLKPFGAEYQSILKQGFSQQWMHTFPQPGKRSGAYVSGGAYDEHPYVLLNFTGEYSAVSTFSHEWGHAVHNILAKRNNSFENYSYSTFIAEMASTTNQVLLQEYMLSQELSDEERLYYIDRALEGIRGTFFRQTMFAEFELKIHELVKGGEPMSGTKMTEIYFELLKKYHGHDEGIMNIDKAFAIEWAFIPHFYRNFYVYQYATSITGGTAFAERMKAGDKSATEDYLNVLKAGGSKYPYALLMENGIDLADDGPYEILMARMNRLMDEADILLKRMGK